MNILEKEYPYIFFICDSFQLKNVWSQLQNVDSKTIKHLEHRVMETRKSHGMIAAKMFLLEETERLAK